MVLLINEDRLTSSSKCKICASKIAKKQQAALVTKLQDEINGMQDEKEKVREAENTTREEKDLYSSHFSLVQSGQDQEGVRLEGPNRQQLSEIERGQGAV